MRSSGSESDDAARLLAPFRARPERSAIVCDVDGTIAPIVPRPEDAVVPDRTRELLRHLSERYALVACVSGRRAIEARRLVGIDSLAYAGKHGLELLAPGAEKPESQQSPAPEADHSGAFARSAYTPLLSRLGVRLEDKDPIWSFHWREAVDEQDANARLAGVAEDAEARGLTTHWGRKVLEIRPTLETDKGTVLEAMLVKTDVDAALYGGDDVTDLDAFRKLRELRSGSVIEHSVCVGVRSDEGPPEIVREADLVVDGTVGFVELLSLLVVA